MARFDDLQIEVLYAICKNAYVPGAGHYFTLSGLEQILGEKISPAIRMALSSLIQNGYIYYSDTRYQITADGIYYIEHGLADQNSEVFTALTHNAAASSTLPMIIPASDRAVALDHNSDPYKRAVNALDAAVIAFREDHRLENEWGGEKGVLIQAIEAGQRLLKESEVRVATIFTTIVTPLRITLDRYRDAVAAGLITAAVDHLIPAIESAIRAVLALIGVS